MSKYQLYWGDFHTHLDDIDNGAAILREAAENIDFCAVLCYPFLRENRNGLWVESLGQQPEFLERWKNLQELSRSHNRPGSFVTFLGYEWHGNRTRYGDHNVIYFDENNPLDPAWALEELYRNMRGRKAIVIPHHTAYSSGWRGKDWNTFDEKLSPVMEIFSTHGSSEGCNTPYPMKRNSSMGPRTAGGSYRDALAGGLRLGVIGSNDLVGLPGRWGLGRAAVWACECTREAIWEAILSRRTYATTGDRIQVEFRINNAPMGSTVQGGQSVAAEANVVGSDAIDRIELLQNGYVVDTYCRSGNWERLAERAKRFKLFIEAGWGPAAQYGFKPKDWKWLFRLDIEAGTLIGMEKCFSLLGQKVLSQDDRHLEWQLLTAGRTTSTPFGMCQGIILELEGSPETLLRLQAEGIELKSSLKELLRASCLIPLLDESKHRIDEIFGLADKDLKNRDPYYLNARKIKLHKAIPEQGYRVQHVFRNLKLEKGRNYFYTRVSQLNGQMAWSSPIWVDCNG